MVFIPRNQVDSGAFLVTGRRKAQVGPGVDVRHLVYPIPPLTHHAVCGRPDQISPMLPTPNHPPTHLLPCPCLGCVVVGASDQSHYRLTVEKHEKQRALAPADREALQAVRCRGGFSSLGPGLSLVSCACGSAGWAGWGCLPQLPRLWHGRPAAATPPARLPWCPASPPQLPPRPPAGAGGPLLRAPRFLRLAAHRPGRL